MLKRKVHPTKNLKTIKKYIKDKDNFKRWGILIYQTSLVYYGY
jgi:hypothetical protein